ncbi:hypothetical protein AXG93_3545s1220 [Marchantia polymorpha subsp. ruderalis]|uniref:Uncharacterized protein n=1 Tax=Marchantia polymorpha subsp. ruderalis TaxID=1480154 RepID=A0A176VYJ8_MARPO|nr:hypothetical protein AXG93_3545s1220 [Marchantia polymorpha subsp. ruderalis]
MALQTSSSHTALLLQQISDVKHQLDEIHGEIEAEITKTRQIERDIIRASENEQRATQERAKWKKILIQKEVQHMDLQAVADASKESIAEAEENLSLTRKRKEELYLKIQEDSKEDNTNLLTSNPTHIDFRDSFIETCKLFQLHQQAEAEIGTGLKLVQRKSNLLAQVAALTKTDEAVKVEDEARSRSKVNKLRDLQNGNEGLQSEVDEENVHNQKLLKRIEGLEDALRLSRSNEDIVRLQAELENLTEEKGVLEDGIVTLQKQIPLLLNHEEKLGGLLKEQQRVLQSFETKIHESIRRLNNALPLLTSYLGRGNGPKDREERGAENDNTGTICSN